MKRRCNPSVRIWIWAGQLGVGSTISRRRRFNRRLNQRLAYIARLRRTGSRVDAGRTLSQRLSLPWVFVRHGHDGVPT